jgi:hypothetical protein
MMIESIGRVRAFSSMVKLSHTVFALPFAASAVVLALGRPHVPLTVGRALAMLGAMVAARTAAMAYNRYLDRDIDGENPRTKDREVPRGIVSPRAALAPSRSDRASRSSDRQGCSTLAAAPGGAGARGASRLLVDQALHLGVAPRARSGPGPSLQGARGSRWAPGPSPRSWR